MPDPQQQGTTQQAPPFDPVAEYRKAYPDDARPDAEIIGKLSDPENFKKAFPDFDYSSPDVNTKISGYMAKYHPQGMMPSDAKISAPAKPPKDVAAFLAQTPSGPVQSPPSLFSGIENYTPEGRAAHPILSRIGDVARKAGEYANIAGPMMGLALGGPEGAATGAAEAAPIESSIKPNLFSSREFPETNAPYQQIKRVPAKSGVAKYQEFGVEMQPVKQPPPKNRLVLSPTEAAAEARTQDIAKIQASKRGMQYAGGMTPPGGKIRMNPFDLPDETQMAPTVVPGEVKYEPWNTEGYIEPGPIRLAKSPGFTIPPKYPTAAKILPWAGGGAGIAGGGYAAYQALKRLGILE